jgi:small Trp-rich protein
MLFLLIGIAGVILKFLEIGPVAQFAWWVILTPFGLTILWWAWADASGYNKNKQIKKMEDRTKERLKKQQEALGMLKRRR